MVFPRAPSSRAVPQLLSHLSRNHHLRRIIRGSVSLQQYTWSKNLDTDGAKQFRAGRGGTTPGDQNNPKQAVAVFPFEQVCSTTEKTCSFPEQTCSTANQISIAAEQICLAVEQVILTANQICFAVERICFAVEQICFAVEQICFAVEQAWLTVEQVCLGVEQVCLGVEQIFSGSGKVLFSCRKVSFLTDQRSSTLNRKEILCLQNAFVSC